MAKAAKKGVRNSSPPKDSATVVAEPENIDKIRDILFGSKERQYDQKFVSLETAIQKEISDLRGETKKSLASLETFVKKELASLGDQLRTEQEERHEAMEDAAAKIDNARKALERKLGQLSDKTVAGQRDLQEQLLQQSKSLLEEIHDKHEALGADLDAAARELRNEKTDRIELANMLMEVALRLKEEFDLPQAE
ncbi:MAG: hypothetical protein QNI85_16890 [Desulfobacterales bacterium]|nr:hypothetical protein [Desulfobacterales bacterium]